MSWLTSTHFPPPHRLFGATGKRDNGEAFNKLQVTADYLLHAVIITRNLYTLL